MITLLQTLGLLGGIAGAVLVAGPITKYHLARNLGVDCVKPDRHLARLAERFGYGTPDAMCRAIQDELGGRLGTIDAVLWRYCNLRGTGSASWH